jgi:hypothetical protein
MLIGAVAGGYAFFKGLLDFNKLILENKKLRHEVAELRRAERQRNSLVQLATPEEQRQFPSLTERKVRRYWKVEERRKYLDAVRFIDREDEEQR